MELSKQHHNQINVAELLTKIFEKKLTKIKSTFEKKEFNVGSLTFVINTIDRLPEFVKDAYQKFLGEVNEITDDHIVVFFIIGDSDREFDGYDWEPFREGFEELIMGKFESYFNLSSDKIHMVLMQRECDENVDIIPDANNIICIDKNIYDYCPDIVQYQD